MAEIFYIKRHDRLPALRLTLLDDETPVDLTNAGTIRLLMFNLAAGLKVDAEVIKLTQTGDTLGQVEYTWVDDDTDTVGSYKAEVEVMWPGSVRQTFPASGYFTIKVTKDLNDE
jgi:hypothetical protein